MTKEIRETLKNFDPAMKHTKLWLILFYICALSNICMSYSTLYNLNPDKPNHLLEPPFFTGYYLLLLAYNGIGFIREPARPFLKNSKKNTNEPSFYHIYPILPVKRQDLLKEDFRYWKYNVILADITLTITNMIYFMNPFLKKLSGYFVFITLAITLGFIFDFASRFHRKRWACIGKVIVMLIYVVTIGILYFNALSNYSINMFIFNFLNWDLFTYFAGIPMLIVSIALAPIIFFIYDRYTGKGRKSAAWYPDSVTVD